MASLSELFRLAGGVVALGLIAAVVGVALVFETPPHWRDRLRTPKTPLRRSQRPF